MQSFQLIKPVSALAPYIRHYWILRDDALLPVSERVLPVGCVQLVFHKGKQLLCLNESVLQPRSFICGQSVGFSDVVSRGEINMITVVFQPHAAKALLHIPLCLFRGQNISVEEIGDVELTDLSKKVADTPDNESCLRLIEDFFLHRLHALLSDYNLNRMLMALGEINRQPQITISRLADVTCLSNKQFGRIFADYVGAAPKEFLRIVRMQRALSMLQQDVTLPLAQVAYECGFFDQSHMIKEFKLFSGYTPTEYLSICFPYSDYFSEP